MAARELNRFEVVSQITLDWTRGKEFRKILTYIINNFRNRVYSIVKRRQEHLDNAGVGSLDRLLFPEEVGSVELLGGCRNSIRFALTSGKVFRFSQKLGQSCLCGELVVKELISFIDHHAQKQDLRTYSPGALEEVKGVVEEFATFFSRCLVPQTSEAQFAIACENEFLNGYEWPAREEKKRKRVTSGIDPSEPEKKKIN